MRGGGALDRPPHPRPLPRPHAATRAPPDTPEAVALRRGLGGDRGRAGRARRGPGEPPGLLRLSGRRRRRRSTGWPPTGSSSSPTTRRPSSRTRPWPRCGRRAPPDEGGGAVARGGDPSVRPSHPGRAPLRAGDPAPRASWPTRAPVPRSVSTAGSPSSCGCTASRGPPARPRRRRCSRVRCTAGSTAAKPPYFVYAHLREPHMPYAAPLAGPDAPLPAGGEAPGLLGRRQPRRAGGDARGAGPSRPALRRQPSRRGPRGGRAPRASGRARPLGSRGGDRDRRPRRGAARAWPRRPQPAGLRRERARAAHRPPAEGPRSSWRTPPAPDQPPRPRADGGRPHGRAREGRLRPRVPRPQPAPRPRSRTRRRPRSRHARREIAPSTACGRAATSTSSTAWRGGRSSTTWRTIPGSGATWPPALPCWPPCTGRCWASGWPSVRREARYEARPGADRRARRRVAASPRVRAVAGNGPRALPAARIIPPHRDLDGRR